MRSPREDHLPGEYAPSELSRSDTGVVGGKERGYLLRTNVNRWGGKRRRVNEGSAEVTGGGRRETVYCTLARLALLASAGSSTGAVTGTRAGDTAGILGARAGETAGTPAGSSDGDSVGDVCAPAGPLGSLQHVLHTTQPHWGHVLAFAESPKTPHASQMHLATPDLTAVTGIHAFWCKARHCWRFRAGAGRPACR